MKPINGIGVLPRALQVLARSFLDSDPYAPEIFEYNLDEMANLRTEDDILFQLVFDRNYENWYLVAVGVYDRIIKSEYFDPDPFKVERTLLAFVPVSNAWIRSKRNEYANKFINEDGYQEFTSEEEDWRFSKWT